MTRQEARDHIAAALVKAVDREDVEFTSETNLIADEILDSLDSMVFIMELSESSGVVFPEDLDLAEAGLFTVGNLIDYLLKQAG